MVRFLRDLHESRFLPNISSRQLVPFAVSRPPECFAVRYQFDQLALCAQMAARRAPAFEPGRECFHTLFLTCCSSPFSDVLLKHNLFDRNTICAKHKVSVSQPSIKWLHGEEINDLPCPTHIGFRIVADILDEANSVKKTVSTLLPVRSTSVARHDTLRYPLLCH